MHCQVLLANMECERESEDNAVIFRKTWNDGLKEYQGKGDTFNSSGLLCDERGCNWKAMELAFGADL